MKLWGNVSPTVNHTTQIESCDRFGIPGVCRDRGYPSEILTHWRQVAPICVGKLAIIGSDNVLSPERRQVIISTNAGLLSTGTLETNFSEILIEIQTFSFKKIHLKMPSGKWRTFWIGLNVLNSSPVRPERPSKLSNRFENLHRGDLCKSSKRFDNWALSYGHRFPVIRV